MRDLLGLDLYHDKSDPDFPFNLILLPSGSMKQHLSAGPHRALCASIVCMQAAQTCRNGLKQTACILIVHIAIICIVPCCWHKWAHIAANAATASKSVRRVNSLSTSCTQDLMEDPSSLMFCQLHSQTTNSSRLPKWPSQELMHSKLPSSLAA